MDRLDFTVIGSAVNEVARIETLCEPLGHRVLASAELASAAGNRIQLETLRLPRPLPRSHCRGNAASERNGDRRALKFVLSVIDGPRFAKDNSPGRSQT